MSARYLKGFPGFLRRVADRLDDKGAPKGMSLSFTFELGEGIRIRDDGKGCPLWYLGDEDYERAHAESDSYRAQAERHAMVDQWLKDRGHTFPA